MTNIAPLYLVYYILLTMKRIVTATIGQPCTNPTRTCVTGNSVCNSNTGACTCANSYVQSGTTCITING